MKTVSGQVVICCVYELCRTCKATFYTCLTFWANLFAHLLLPKSSMDSRTRRRNQHTTAIKFPTPICTVSIFLSLFKIFTHISLSIYLSIFFTSFGIEQCDVEPRVTMIDCVNTWQQASPVTQCHQGKKRKLEIEVEGDKRQRTKRTLWRSKEREQRQEHKDTGG